MPTISIPGLSVASAESFNDAVVNNTSDDDSLFGPLAGALDRGNVDWAGTPLDYLKFQKGSLCDAWSSYGTASLDYRNYWFTELDSDDYVDESSSADRGLVVPGSATTFYLPTTSHVLMLWHIFWTTDSQAAAHRALMTLRVDGNSYPAHRRRTNQVCPTSTHIAEPPEDRVHYGYNKSRVYYGANFLELTAGWHTAGLDLIGDQDVLNTRVYCRSMKVIRLGESG